MFDFTQHILCAQRRRSVVALPRTMRGTSCSRMTSQSWGAPSDALRCIGRWHMHPSCRRCPITQWAVGGQTASSIIGLPSLAIPSWIMVVMCLRCSLTSPSTTAIAANQNYEASSQNFTGWIKTAPLPYNNDCALARVFWVRTPNKGIHQTSAKQRR